MNIKNFIIITNILFFFGCSYIVKTIIPLNSLPAPSGNYTVGTTSFSLVDKSRLEWFTKSDSTDFRKIMIQIWYPSNDNPMEESLPYIDNIESRISAISHQIELPKYLIKQINYINTHTYDKLSISENSHPVILFSHGLGGMRVQNSSYIQELVSHGYIVVAMDHTYDANVTIFPDDIICNYKSALPDSIKTDEEALEYRIKQLNIRTNDVIFVLNELEIFNNNSKNIFFNKLKLEKVGIFGHSFGGATSISCLEKDSRIVAAISLDGWYEILPVKSINNGLSKPFIHIGQEKWESKLNYANRDELMKNSKSEYWLYTFLGSKHLDFMDLPLFSSISKYLKLTGKINPNQFYDCLNEIQLSFFGKYLKGGENFNPISISKKYSFMKEDKAQR